MDAASTDRAPAATILRALRAAARATAETAPEALDPDRLDRRDPELIATVLPALELMARHYLRLRVEGREHIPREPAIYVANHNGGIMGPDLGCTMATLWRALGPEWPLYGLAHDFAMRHVTRLGRLLQRLGAVRASHDNAERALRAGGQVVVYPGGDLDAYRRFDRRERVVFGPRAGFVRLAQRTGLPVVPVVAQGAHRSALIVHEGHRLARVLGLRRGLRVQCCPVALALPWGVAIGPWMPYLPLPFPIRLRLLAPRRIRPGLAPGNARDALCREMTRAMASLARRG